MKIQGGPGWASFPYKGKKKKKEAMSNMKIYSVETRNIRRGEAESDILGETE